MIVNPHPNTPRPAPVLRKPINPHHVAPPGHVNAHYFAQFGLPDGEHAIMGITSPNPREAKEAIERILIQNPEVDFDFEHDFRYVRDIGDAAKLVEELKQKKGEALTAAEMGMDSPARILTNPEVIAGSKAEFDQMVKDGVIPEDSTFVQAATRQRIILNSVPPVGTTVHAPAASSAIAPPGTIVR